MYSSWKRDIALEPACEGFRRFKLTLSYFGKDFYGWQRQSSDFECDDKSVQCAVEKAIFKITGKWCRVYGSGRTDSGVHALGQVAHFDSDRIEMEENKLRLALNANLPCSIRIGECQERKDAFHARFSTFLRQYIYKMKDDKSFSALDNERIWNIRKCPDIDNLNLMADLIKGEDVNCKCFDFTPPDVEHSSYRDILTSRFYIDEYGVLCYVICANAFLYHQVRALVGTFIEYERKTNCVDEFKKLLKSGEKVHFIAPSCGLYLDKIIYDKSEYETLRSFL